MNMTHAAYEVAVSVNLLEAIRCMDFPSLGNGSINHIPKCFCKAGVLTASMYVCTRAMAEEDDHFEEVNRHSETQLLTECTMGANECCTCDEYVSGDDCLAVWLDLDDDQYEKHFMADLDGDVDTENGVSGMMMELKRMRVTWRINQQFPK